MAERLPVGAARNYKPPSMTSFSASSASSDISAPTYDCLSSPVTSFDPDSNGSNSIPVANGPTTNGNRSASHNRPVHSEVPTRNGARVADAEPNLETEWVEQDEAGVYITLTALAGGVKDLKRVRFRYFKAPHAYLVHRLISVEFARGTCMRSWRLPTDGIMCAVPLAF